MNLSLDLNSIEDYERFLAIKRLPFYRFQGRSAWFPDEYADRITGIAEPRRKSNTYKPSDFLFDYQAGISRTAIAKRKYCIFGDCGLGKTLIYLEYAKHVLRELSV